MVVGAGLAGTRTVTALREQGFDGVVTLLAAEPDAPYDRPPLSKHLLDRPAPTLLRDELGTDALALADDVRLGTAAHALRVLPGTVEVLTDDGTLTADALVVASGSHAVRPVGWQDAHVLHTASDAARLRPLLVPGARLVVIGAGWIGAEVAGVAAAAGVHVEVVEALPAPLAGPLGVAVGAALAPWYADAGVVLHTGVQVSRVHPGGVDLADGRAIEADVVLAAVGARPATGWLADALPLEPDGSVRVDAGYAPEDGPAHVRAVGDVARRRSPRHGLVPGGHWDGALRGPDVAVRALLGTAAADLEPLDDPAPYVFSTQLGHELAMFGHRGPHDDLVLRGDAAGGPDGWSALWFEAGSDVLTAVLTVDRPRDVGAARRLFAGRTLPRLDPARAADTDVPLRGAVRS